MTPKYVAAYINGTSHVLEFDDRGYYTTYATTLGPTDAQRVAKSLNGAPA